MKKNPVCTILWSDAAYSYDTEPDPTTPTPCLTTGFIFETNEQYTFIATNVKYDKDTGILTAVDGLIIPEKAILEFKRIGDYHPQE